MRRNPEKSGIPDTYFHDLPESAVSTLRKSGINRWDLRRSDDPLVWKAVLWEASHIRGTGISIPGRIPEDFPVPGTDVSSPDDPDRGRAITWHAGSTLFYQGGD